MASNKVTVVGAGNVGASTAQRILEASLADVVLVDIIEGLPQGKALDLAEAAPIVGHAGHIVGTNDYADTAGSDVIVITSGLARQPGMSRDDLLARNAAIVRSVVEQAAPRSPDAILIVVTNPLDAMCHVALRTSGFPGSRVIGMAGVLDSARFRTFLAMETGVSVTSTSALVLGGHGDSMVPLPSRTTVGGVPITELLTAEQIDRIVKRTRGGGGEIVALLKSGSAYYAPAASVFRMVEAILGDRHGDPALRRVPAGPVRHRRPVRGRPRAARPAGRGADRGDRADGGRTGGSRGIGGRGARARAGAGRDPGAGGVSVPRDRVAWKKDVRDP